MSLTTLINQKKTDATNQINTNTDLANAITEIIQGLNQQISSYNTQKDNLETLNTTLSSQLNQYDEILVILDSQ